MRTVKTLGVHFWVNKQKEINGEVLLYARVTIDQKRVNISLKRKVPLKLWDSKQRKVIGSSSKAKEINEYLELTKSELYNHYQILRSSNKLITADDIKNEFLQEGEDSKTLIELINYHRLKIENTHAVGSIRNFKVSEGYVIRFLKKKRVTDISLSDLNYKFLCDFETFLNAYYPKGHPKAMSHNTVTKHIQRLRKIVTLAYNLEWIKDDPFRRWKSTFDKVDREFLSDSELSRLAIHRFSIDRLDRVRDLFVFSSYTGISYVDIKNLTKKNVWIGDDEGNKWISTFRQKTNSKIKIPLLFRAEQILKKYDSHPVTQILGTLLPSISNEKANLYLKEIATEVGIDKNLTFHMARHTFATTVALSNGMPIETVSKILGHTKITTTQIYARVMDHKIKSDMDAVQKRLNEKARKFEEENELKHLREEIVEAEKTKYSNLTKEQLIEKLSEVLNEKSDEN
ncbi:site-specific recombinase XerD [Winogradskyella pacifica]|uniref:Site-specific recombinase XerD n=1 Tax=Winogradskyella pacifica TaxID=664642 RepID=A0A3D9N9S7_9FLAO|nr:site-specific integrase [Winogradskyella pacifica]REE27269.1 site-specific recombinase XerD [Winogradskyella pacifica]